MKQRHAFTLLLALLFLFGSGPSSPVQAGENYNQIIYDQSQITDFPSFYSDVIPADLYQQMQYFLTREGQAKIPERPSIVPMWYVWRPEYADGHFGPWMKTQAIDKNIFADQSSVKIHFYAFRTIFPNPQDDPPGYIRLYSAYTITGESYKNDQGYLTYWKNERVPMTVGKIEKVEMNEAPVDYKTYEYLYLKQPPVEKIQAHYEVISFSREECKMMSRATDIDIAPGLWQIQGYGGTLHHGSLSFYAGSVMPMAYSEFHFVNVWDYKKLQKLAPAAPVQERSEINNPEHKIYSPEPQHALALPDLAPLYKTGSRFYHHMKNGYSINLPNLKYPGDDRKQVGNNTPADDPARHKTLAEVQATVIPGYVFLADDIDKPKKNAQGEWMVQQKDHTENFGNYVNSLMYSDAGPDAKIVDTKHYYLLYAPLPLSLSFQKQDENGKALAGAIFDLYAVKNGEKILLQKSLKTDETGKLLLTKTKRSENELKALLQDPPFIEDAPKGIYRAGEDLYLMPGDYVLVETTAPEGYQKQDFPFQIQVGDDGKTLPLVNKKGTPPPTPPTPTPPTPPVSTPPRKDRVPNTGAATCGSFFVEWSDFCGMERLLQKPQGEI